MRRSRHPVRLLLAALSIAIVAFAYRFNTLGGPLAGFDNDHFFQIVRTDAMLDGELPLRDYADTELRSLWPPLSYATSAGGMRILGRSLRSEALVSIGMLATGAALLCVVVALVTDSVALGALMALLAVGLGPTLYNYPKLVPYAAAVLAMLAYARRPTTWRLVPIATVVVMATLYRHDHGVFLATALTVLLVGLHGRTAMRPLLWSAALIVVGLLPGVVFAQQHGGFLAYLRDCLAVSRREANRTSDLGLSLGFHFDTSQPLLTRSAPAEAPPPRIGVRWQAGLTPDIRQAAERELGLIDPEVRGDGASYGYTLQDPSRARLAAIAGDRRVADTDGFNRQTLTMPAPEIPARSTLSGWRVAPGVFHGDNATPWLLLMAWLAIAGAAVGLALPPIRRQLATADVPAPFLAAVTALGVILYLVFLRTPAPFRLPDVAVPIAVLGGRLLVVLPRLAGPVLARRVVTAALAAAVVATAVGVGAVGTVREQLVGMGATTGLDAVERRWQTNWTTLGALPDALEGIDPPLAASARYLRRCTLVWDRVLVTDYVPELHYFARRGFAAGQSVFFGGFYTSPAAQQQAIARWQRQSVPIALTQTGERFTREFADAYPLLADYLRQHYRQTGRLLARDGVSVDVWIATSRLETRDEETGLPCFGEQ